MPTAPRPPRYGARRLAINARLERIDRLMPTVTSSPDYRWMQNNLRSAHNCTTARNYGDAEFYLSEIERSINRILEERNLFNKFKPGTKVVSYIIPPPHTGVVVFRTGYRLKNPRVFPVRATVDNQLYWITQGNIQEVSEVATDNE